MARSSRRKRVKRTGEGVSSPRRERTWREWMRRWKRSGLTQAAFCARHDLSLASFRGWRSELKRRDRQGPRLRSAGRDGTRSAPGEEARGGVRVNAAELALLLEGIDLAGARRSSTR